jgi:anti-sigma factor RsiW
MTTSDQPISEYDFHAYVDGFLDPARRTSVEGYLADHPQVAERIAGWWTVNEALRKAVTWKAEQPVPAALNVARVVNARSSQRWVPWRMAASILVALTVGAGSGWIAHRPSPENGIASVATEASMAQQVFAADSLHPVEFGPDEQSQLVKWVSLRLGRPVAPPDLSESGYRLLGGRIIGTEHGPGCMFLYESNAGVRITLFVRPMQGIDMNAKMQPVQTANTAGFVWSHNGVGFGLVSNNPMATLHEVANRVRGEMSSDT